MPSSCSPCNQECSTLCRPVQACCPVRVPLTADTINHHMHLIATLKQIKCGLQHTYVRLNPTQKHLHNVDSVGDMRVHSPHCFAADQHWVKRTQGTAHNMPASRIRCRLAAWLANTALTAQSDGHTVLTGVVLPNINCSEAQENTREKQGETVNNSSPARTFTNS